jgi:hypothetical protein
MKSPIWLVNQGAFPLKFCCESAFGSPKKIDKVRFFENSGTLKLFYLVELQHLYLKFMETEHLNLDPICWVEHGPSETTPRLAWWEWRGCGVGRKSGPPLGM